MELQKLLKRRNKTLEAFLLEEKIDSLKELSLVCVTLGAELDKASVLDFELLQTKKIVEVVIEEQVEDFKEIKIKKKKEVIITETS